MKEIVFVSSVQKELADERTALRDFITGNRLLARHFDVFLFEDLPAKDRQPDDLYLGRVDKCGIFLALFAREYGWEDPKDGVSPTEREFDLATELSKHRLVFLKNLGGETPHPKMALLTSKAKSQLTYRRFSSTAELTTLVYDSLIEYLEDRRIIQNKPFDAALCADASLEDVSADKIRWFINSAREERNLNLSTTASPEEVLTHLKLFEAGHLVNAATLLFCRDPQKWAASAIVKCAVFHGTEVAKPIPSHQVFGGTLFDQVDGAVDFVMGKLVRTVGTRNAGSRAPVQFEMPREAIAEIIVNAVAHRDYASNASVQVFVFSDRIEVSSPGRLPKGLQPEHLAKPHSSEPANPLIAGPLYLAHYIESLGTGTLDVIRLCRQANLPVPDFVQRGNQFVVTLWRDYLTDDFLRSRDLIDRQIQGVLHVKKAGRITNSEYQDVAGVSRKTATRDLVRLVEEDVFERIGTKRGAYYVLAGRR